MNSILNRISRRGASSNSDRTILVEDDKVPEKPFILAATFYLLVLLFIGLPMWFYTCSVTRFPLPELDILRDKLLSPSFNLHLDISIVQLSKHDQLTNHLRSQLPRQFKTSLEKVNYNIGWRIRRPTRDEEEVLLSQKKQDQFSSETLANFEQQMTKIHKPTNRFRLFMYLVEEPYFNFYCDSVSPFTISFERFVFICAPKNDFLLIESLIKDILKEVYDTVDLRNNKNILASQLDLLFSLLPESNNVDSVQKTFSFADKIHHIYDKNIKFKFPELKELVNMRFVTQDIFDLMTTRQLNRVLEKTPANETRILPLKRVGTLFNLFESRISKPPAQYLQNILFIITDPQLPPIIFEESTQNLNILESRDSNYLSFATDDKSLVLGMRGLLREIIGLKSANLCRYCQTRRDVFLNKWEIDAIMGALIITKLDKTFVSLNSISQQVIGIKIPREVSQLTQEAHKAALESIQHLETKQLLEAYRYASRAYELSEKAYYDPSLLESLYFPDELKYAIYLPLFLPMALPLLMSAVRVIKYLYYGERKTDTRQ